MYMYIHMRTKNILTACLVASQATDRWAIRIFDDGEGRLHEDCPRGVAAGIVAKQLR